MLSQRMRLPLFVIGTSTPRSPGFRAGSTVPLSVRGSFRISTLSAILGWIEEDTSYVTATPILSPTLMPMRTARFREA